MQVKEFDYESLYILFFVNTIELLGLSVHVWNSNQRDVGLTMSSMIEFWADI